MERQEGIDVPGLDREGGMAYLDVEIGALQSHGLARAEREVLVRGARRDQGLDGHPIAADPLDDFRLGRDADGHTDAVPWRFGSGATRQEKKEQGSGDLHRRYVIIRA